MRDELKLHVLFFNKVPCHTFSSSGYEFLFSDSVKLFLLILKPLENFTYSSEWTFCTPRCSLKEVKINWNQLVFSWSIIVSFSGRIWSRIVLLEKDTFTGQFCTFLVNSFLNFIRRQRWIVLSICFSPFQEIQIHNSFVCVMWETSRRAAFLDVFIVSILSLFQMKSDALMAH